MRHFHNRAAITHALTLPDLPPVVRERMATLSDDLMDWTEYLVIEPGDTEEEIIRHVGFSPLIEPIDGIRYGQAGFHPFWDWIAGHDGWFEMVVTFGSTQATIIFTADVEDVDPLLRQLCRYQRDG